MAPPEPASSFETTFDVRASDIDELGHVNNISYVRWVQDVAVAHSNAVGLDFDAYRRLGGIFVVRRQEIDYLRPVLLGDAVRARTWIGAVMAAKCVRHTELRARDGALVASARTVWGFVDAKVGRPMRILAPVKVAFGMVAGPAPAGRDGPGAAAGSGVSSAPEERALSGPLEPELQRGPGAR